MELTPRKQKKWTLKIGVKQTIDFKLQEFVIFQNGLSDLQTNGGTMNLKELEHFCSFLNKMPDLFSWRLKEFRKENERLKEEIENLKDKVRGFVNMTFPDKDT